MFFVSKFMLTETSAFQFYIHPEMIPRCTSKRQNDGALFKVSKKSFLVSFQCLQVGAIDLIYSIEHWLINVDF
jgi:hypothetical protein